eukprot:2160749-Prorocentrum_lima.AAC.1
MHEETLHNVRLPAQSRDALLPRMAPTWATCSGRSATTTVQTLVAKILPNPGDPNNANGRKPGNANREHADNK